MTSALKAAFAVLAVLPAIVVAQGNGCVESGGNWYCNNVTAITYNNFGSSGTYKQVVDMQDCKTKDVAYSGPLAPLDEEVTVVFRGPIRLKQFAAYAPGSKSKVKRNEGHAHGHQHAHLHKEQKRGMQWIHATIDGQAVSWQADPASYGGAPAATAAPAPAPANNAPDAKPSAPAAPAAPAAQDNAQPAAQAGTAAPSYYNPGPSQAPAPAQGSSGSGASAPVALGDWGQVGHYHAESQKADGVVFLKTLYAPLTYCAADGTTTTSKSETLKDILVPSNQEFTIWTDSKCSGQNGDCGYFNPGVPAYHGWAGPSKAFLFEFAMPSDGCQEGQAPDAPAIWLLNSQVPRTEQYGCSCWQSGCGEFDLFEVLTKGEHRMKATLHDQKQSYGSSDYFERPNGNVKAAVIMHNNAATLAMLPDSFDIGSSLSADQIKQILGMQGTVASLPN